eukprot:Partr_v1_DN28739_c1_g1_i5_m61661 putative Aminotransferase class I and II
MKQVWDTTLQQFHGGQDWKFLKNFIEDFSVTTNGLGTPKAALEAASQALTQINHYPPANQEPALSSLASWLCPSDVSELEDRLILGNGASELIDLVVRCADGGAWTGGPTDTQYMEYERSARSHGRAIVKSPSDARLVSVVNPTNPTGDYMDVEAMKRWIEVNVRDGSTVTVDESMQLWVGPEWRADSLVGQHAWIRSMLESRRIAVFVIHSWTKIWSCTGLRLGSVVCPSRESWRQLKALQVPWSVNGPALAFLHRVVDDCAFMTQTWQLTEQWNGEARSMLQALEQAKGWTLHGRLFLSWIWIDMREEAVAERAVQLANAAGVPVRWGKFGYMRPSFVRIAVRRPELTGKLVDAWKSL